MSDVYSWLSRLFTARSEQAALNRSVWPTIQLVM